MNQLLESLMYQASQVFLLPTLLAIALLFVYAFFLLGAFAAQWWQRRAGVPAGGLRGYHLLHWAKAQPSASADELDVKAHQLLELPRIATRVAPMLGLIATMIPMGPALKGLSSGNLGQVSDNLAVAFAAVILALIAAAITFWVVSVQRRWLAEELAWLQRQGVRTPAAGELADAGAEA
jgi:biopolymer transport protein ExbB/TolQ